MRAGRVAVVVVPAAELLEREPVAWAAEAARVALVRVALVRAAAVALLGRAVPEQVVREPEVEAVRGPVP